MKQLNRILLGLALGLFWVSSFASNIYATWYN